MTVSQLISKLKKMPQNKRVYCIQDGEPRCEINVLYESNNGAIILADYNEVVYSKDARPKGENRGQYWHTRNGIRRPFDNYEI